MLFVDIGTNSIKALEKDPEGKISRWGKLERNSKPFHTSISPMDEKDVIEHLKILLAKMGALSHAIVVSIPAFLTFTAIAESADPKHIPAAAGAFQLDSIGLAPGKFFLTAVPRDVIEKYGRILGAVGCQSASWESKAAVLAKNFSVGREPILIVDLDDRSTLLMVAEDGKPVFAEHTDFTQASGAPDVIMNKVKNIVTEKKIKNIRWVTKNFFYSF